MSGFELLGGLALFLFGMDRMTKGLRAAAGARLRAALDASTRRRSTGFLLGTAMGALAHSSASTLMLAGLVNAGLLSLGAAIAPVVGANVGTTLSMQVLSFRLDAYALAAVAAGFLWSLAAPGERAKQAGLALLGFGLLFLGMQTMSGAVRPHREWLAPLLARLDGATPRGMLLGLAASAAVTGVLQSSGATIGIAFALAAAGVFTRLDQVLPLVLGAHVGTCATALLGSIGTRLDARRTAVAHLLFNGINAALGAAAAPWLARGISALSGDLVRQIAHAHTAVMLLGAAVVLPLAGPFERAVRALVGRGAPSPRPTWLDRSLRSRPEQALQAGVRELGRALALVLESMRLDAELFFRNRPSTLRRILHNEQVVNEIKDAMLAYLAALASGYLSRRQIMLSQHLDRCISDIERIGDHVEKLAGISARRARYGIRGYVDDASFRDLFEAFRQAAVAVRLAVLAFDPSTGRKFRAAQALLEARDVYMAHSRAARQRFAGRVACHAVTPIAALFFSEYLAALDRIVRHVRVLALALHHSDFWIKPAKLDRAAAPQAPAAPVEPVEPRGLLDRLDADLAAARLPEGEIAAPPGPVAP